jgi:hypothetical protein
LGSEYRNSRDLDVGRVEAVTLINLGHLVVIVGKDDVGAL